MLSADLWRIASRRQFARPAVEESFLDQMILIPSVDSASEDTLPPLIIRSTSARKAVAISPFCLSNNLRLSVAALSLLVALLSGLLHRATEGERSSSFVSSMIDLLR